MKNIKYLVAAFLIFSPTAYAADASTVLGGALGGAAGAVVGQNIGGRDGAVLGAAIGGAAGAAIGSDSGEEYRSHPVYVERVSNHDRSDDAYEHRHHDRGHHYGERRHHRDEGDD